MDIKKKYIRQSLIHLVSWLAFYGLMLYPFIFEFGMTPPGLPFVLFVITALFYLNYFYLVPKLLMRKNIIAFFFISLLIIITVALFINFSFSPQFPRTLPSGEHFRRGNLGIKRILAPMFTMVIPFAVSTLLRIYIEWRKNEDLRKIVETEKVNSELQFLKTQLNPHFLFNSLNAIYSLSVQKSSNTSEAIISLSELMRYMLYEANKDFVPLAKELEYIKNYVQLQRLRLADSENVILKITGETKGKLIPPLLFISFIENAFKYGTDYKGKTNVIINLSIKEESIQLHVENTIGSFKKKLKSSGVGLENIRYRLALLYPDSHVLIVNNNKELYIVNLTVNL